MSRKNELIVSQAKSLMFMISNAMIVHEALAATGALRSVQPLAGIDCKDPISWLKKEWEKILNTNYRPIFEPAYRLLSLLPSNQAVLNILCNLTNIARKAVGNRAIFRHDLAGRLYHRLLLREVAKGLATYYTSISASALLASLSLDFLQTRWEDFEDIGELRIADLACGSGTLLSAVYSEIMDRHTFLSENPNPQALHKVLLENVLYGFDVLEYAIHLASSALVLRRPEEPIFCTNTFVLPLGVINNKAYLGSLDLEVRTDEVLFPVAKTLYGTSSTEPYRATINDKAGTSVRFRHLDMVIMNPPFARTGNVGKSTLFGHLPEASRREVLEKLKKCGKTLVKNLKLDEGFGRAGLAPYFVLQAYRVLKDRGVLALVLPRVFLSGSDWSSVRRFLSNKGKIEYIIVSDDPDGNWAWSENTVLSEILLIYTKSRTNNKNYTVVVFVRRKPSSALESKIYADMIREAWKRLSPKEWDNGEKTRSMPDFTNTEVVYVNEKPALYVYGVKYSNLKNASSVNLNLVVGFHNSLLSSVAYRLFFKKELLIEESKDSKRAIKIPLIPLSEYIERYVCKTFVSQAKSRYMWEKFVSYDVAEIRRKCLMGDIPVGFLGSLSKQTFSKLKLPENTLRRIHTNEDCYSKAGKLLIPGVARFWLYTVGVVASYSNEPILSEVAWTIPLEDDDAKIQVLWLNSTLGLTHLLSLRQDSKGAFVQLKKKLLGYLMFIDRVSLSENAKSELISFFNKHSEHELGDIKGQLREAQNKKGYRYELDRIMLKAVCGVNLDSDKAVEQRLLSLYRALENETLFSS
ncbi:MAG: hypothetical protein QXZ60_04695 [Sulfolobales archaeon]